MSDESTTNQRALRLLSVNDLPPVWESHVEPLLREACALSAGEFTPDAVLAGMGLHDGVERLKMLAMIEGDEIASVMVVNITEGADASRTLNCLLVGGRGARSWMPFEPLMDEWARGFGCARVRVPRGRKGWHKVLQHWDLAGYVLEREIA